MATRANSGMTADLNKNQLSSLLQHISSYISLFESRASLVSKLEEQDRTYMCEVDRSIDKLRADAAQRRGDTTKFRNVVIPVAMPKVETAVTYQTSIFLQGYPIFGVVADPKNADAALQLETVLENQQIRGGWVDELQKCFRDGFKYNLFAAEVTWNTETTFAVSSDSETSDAALDELAWSGNVLKRLDLYNMFFDPRVDPTKIAKEGEFVGYHELCSWVSLFRKLKALGLSEREISNLAGEHVSFENNNRDSRTGLNHGFGYKYNHPQLSDTAIITSVDGGQWSAFLPSEKQSKATVDSMFHDYLRTQYQLTTVYGWIIPSQHGISNVTGWESPQRWKFVVVNGSKIVLAEQLTNAHQLLPIIVAQPNNDGLGHQTKSLLENVTPFQQLNTAIANASIHARRRSISNQMLFDPSRISPGVINNDNPTSKIPVKSSAFGDDLSKAVYVIPHNDNLNNVNTQDIAFYDSLADLVTGQNQARQGQFVKGNKTRTEYVDIMTNAQGRDHTVSLSLESTFFTPLKEVLKSNIIQYQGPTTYYNREERQAIEITPQDLRNAMLVFKVTDGLNPNDKVMDSETLTVAFQTLQSVPQIGGGYNIPELFSYLMKSKGAKIDPFKKSNEQIAYEDAVGQWQQAIAQMVQMATLIKIETIEQVQELMEQLPPQPTPEQFGWNPDDSPAQTTEVSILEQIANNRAAQNSQGLGGGEVQ